MAIRYKNPQTGEYEVIKIPVVKGEQGHAGIHVGTDAPPTTDVKLWFDPSDTDNDVDLANRLDTTLTACYDYMGNDRGSIKEAADANVEYILGEVNTVHYEGQHITATDTIEKQVRSAILKGSTLVNVIKTTNYKITDTSYKTSEYSYVLDTTKTYLLQYRVNQIAELSDSSDNGRVLKFEWYGGDTSGSHLNIYNKDFTVGKNETLLIKPFAGEVTRTTFGVRCPNYVGGTLDIDIMLIEYQDGMENWTIPYFTGMQSVRMPVLTTNGKNLYTGEQLMWTIDSNNAITTHGKESLFYFRCKPNTTYTFTTLIGNQYGRNRVHECYEEPKVGTVVTLLKNNISTNTTTITTSANAKYIVWQNFNNDNGTYTLDDLKQNAQIEENSVATSYEPFKSNILSCTEEIELRGIGDVQDTLDCMTGELVENVSSYVITGEVSENWWIAKTSDDFTLFHFTDHKLPIADGNYVNNIMSESIPSATGDDLWSLRCEGIGNNRDIIRFIKKGITTVDELRNYFKTNPTRILYGNTENVVKTVDLSGQKVYSYDGTTHYNCSAAEGALVPTLSIDVPTNLPALVTKQRQQIETLKEENQALTQDLQLAIASSEENDNELLAQSFELDFRLMEVECALDLPMAATFRLGGKAMAMTPYEMAKKLILADNYDRADMEHKLDVYVSKKRMTEAERQELIQLMDEKEGIISIDPVEPEVEESIIEHEAVTIPLH